MEKEETKLEEVEKFKDVWVFAEQRRGKLVSVVYELLGKGKELATSLNVSLAAVVLGENNEENIEELIAYGVDTVYSVEASFLKSPSEEVCAKILVDLIEKHRPEIFLAGATSFGRSLLPKVATMLETGLTADCTALEIDTKKRLLKQIRPTFGGNIMATIICPKRRPQMATVRPHVMPRAKKVDGKGKVVSWKLTKEPQIFRVRLLDFVEDVTEKVKLEDADIIISGGRGLGKKENFKLVEELADVLGAAVGASRAAVDAGWISYPHQVGQTGKTVSPKLYIACGISGAIQHLAGMQTSDVIVAINKDRNAPIFEVANYGIVGNIEEVLPLLTREFKKVLGKG